jgi:SPP1 family predicted phage head-tail adaptor
VSLGQYTKRYLVQAPTATDDNAGGQTVTWGTVLTIWASVRSVSSREQAQAGGLQVIGTHRVATHYADAITPTTRLVPKGWTGPTLEVLGVRDFDGSQRELWLDCAEVI